MDDMPNPTAIFVLGKDLLKSYSSPSKVFDKSCWIPVTERLEI